MSDREQQDDAVTRIAFGTARVSAEDLGKAQRTVRRAYDVGIRHFDTSVGYGSAAQASLTALIRSVPRDDLFVSTKVGHFRDPFPNAMALYRNEDALWGAVHECSRILRHHVDLLQIHEADRAYWWTASAGSQKTVVRSEDLAGWDDAPIVRVMQRAKREGVCRIVGATGNSAGPLRAVCEHLDVDSVMCAYNLDPIFRGAAEKIQPLASKRSLLFMAAGIFHAGSYVRPRNLPDRLASDARIKERFERFAHIADESGLAPAELLLRWTFQYPRVDRWVVSASSPEQIENTIHVINRGPLPADLHRAVDELALPDLEYDPAAR